jgi:hypothetical protein
LGFGINLPFLHENQFFKLCVALKSSFHTPQVIINHLHRFPKSSHSRSHQPAGDDKSKSHKSLVECSTKINQRLTK